MTFLEVESLNLHQEKVIHRMWNNEYPIEIRHKELRDTQTYLNNLSNPFHVFYCEKDIKAWYCDFDREGKRFFVMILCKSVQRRGIGSALLNMAKKRNNSLYGWIVTDENYSLSNGRKYFSPAKFYTNNDFQIKDDCHSPKNILKTVLINWQS